MTSSAPDSLSIKIADKLLEESIERIKVTISETSFMKSYLIDKILQEKNLTTYRTKISTVTAMQWDGTLTTMREIEAMFGLRTVAANYDCNTDKVYDWKVQQRQLPVQVSPSDWFVSDESSVTVYKDVNFKARFELNSPVLPASTADVFDNFNRC